MWLFDTKKKYRHILILDSIDYWKGCRDQFVPDRDLVLTYDMGLKLEVSRLGGQAFYMDHLVDNVIMQENNHLIYQFFREWHWNEDGEDIFKYRGVPFGFSFRLEIWNDFVFYARTRLCLESLLGLEYEKIFVGTELGLVESVLDEMTLSFVSVPADENKKYHTYYFPIHRWMDERIRHKGLAGVRSRLRDMVMAMQGTLMLWVDYLVVGRLGKPAVFVQEYYPTRRLVQRLQQDSKVRLILASFSRNKGWLRYIPVWGSRKKFKGIANALMRNYKSQRCSRLILSNGVDITEGIYKAIDNRIEKCVTETVHTLDCVISYMDKNPVKLEVLIANLGLIPTLVDCVCKVRGVPSYLIINGLLGNDAQDESKYATVINSYSVSIKEHYFRGMENIVCLGDPRMDQYIQKNLVHLINREEPTVIIGSSAHSPVDLNSYLAVEFDFMYDILSALQIIKDQGVQLKIIIKVRANGYRKQYQSFISEFFPGVVDEVQDTAPFSTVIQRADFYISLYSQTLFEASCLGIPCLYYKNDCEILDPPFDGNSELVTVDNIEDLVQAFQDFRSGHPRYDAFLKKSVMEKYIGHLDGGNTDRNIHFIEKLLRDDNAG